MNRWEALEALTGLAALCWGLAQYLGWPPVAIGAGAILLAGGLVPAIQRWRSDVS